MDDRDAIRRRLVSAYAARARGSLDETLALFSEQPSFRLIGSGPLAKFARHCEDVQSIVETLLAIETEYELDDIRVDDVLVDGARAAVLWHMTVTGRRTGRRTVMELVDYIRFDRGKITSFTEFYDTAKAAALLA
ncbi:nuclear transport factor 2 family protein [Chelatococcus sp. SYSU_G07232]|uniref:Nuclear transport factor 2 family protein n=1 Tax=Chelatococcus albus TaxID=3047466 RepID=A0ABT7AGV0_9HYPH|nr:nuclear transport factor 2 family protein [Chelatococcus sp. SYSU_G07232]MDJ1158558.1 nuclear transport factor 2 family protein [Chelatococcus sp. SYSU_G07232]